MNILVTNDDGIDHLGIKILVSELSKKHNIFVAAPNTQCSGLSGAVTFYNYIRVEKYPLDVGEKSSYKIHGTPADCVIIGLDELVKNVDLVISGLNDEPNVGDDTRLSGTLGACIESVFSSTPAIAFSMDYGQDNIVQETAIFFIKKIVDFVEKNPLPEGIYLNVNIPNKPISSIKGIKITRLGRRRYKNRVNLADDNIKNVYKIYGQLIKEYETNTDSWALDNDYVSITPFKIDNTDYDNIDYFKVLSDN
ncbi:5'/3'-nucleotidase SurE [Clostridiisalibacter paucivorans]|uniref:5'/3'-nucleotidase SurE n=1 Tax=Clostridiisalibacter paucivorans TaxID=408753 RepID=UPI00047CCC6A|nr:5'/3'-nucleotidase SurE [Clostridiisalibacter paucivorans]